MKITAIVGSLRKNSFNRQVAMRAKELLENKVDFEILEYSDVPILNQDEEFPPPESVTRVREVVKNSDGIWLFMPEYNHSYSGALKNLIDWLSRPVDGKRNPILANKPIAFSGATPGSSGTILAQDHLMPLLSMLNMDVMNRPRLSIPMVDQLIGEDGRLDFSTLDERIEKQGNSFIEFIEKRKNL